MTCRCTCTAYGGHCDCWFHGNTQAKLSLGADVAAATLRAEHAEAERDVLMEQLAAMERELDRTVADYNALAKRSRP